MKLPFVKMQGAGNDYIYIDGFSYFIAEPDKLSKRLSNRHFGVGGDGLVMILPSRVAHCRMQMFNADGSEGRMCGNAIRCVALWMELYDGFRGKSIEVETLSGIKTISYNRVGKRTESLSVQMGRARFKCKEIPMDFAQEQCIDVTIDLNGEPVAITALSMGNPHAVTFVVNVDMVNIMEIGPLMEHHPLFPERVNTEFVEVVSDKHIRMRVWERGSAETMACGTGACAAVAAGIQNGLLPFDTPIRVELLGGDLYVAIDKNWEVTLSGEAQVAFTGEVEVADVILVNG